MIRVKRDEHADADHIERATLYLAASDYKPVVDTYAVAPTFDVISERYKWTKSLSVRVVRVLHDAGSVADTDLGLRLGLSADTYRGCIMQPAGRLPGLIAVACKMLPMENEHLRCHLVCARIGPDGRVNRTIPETVSTKRPPGFVPSKYRAWYPKSVDRYEGGSSAADRLTMPDAISIAWQAIQCAWSVSFSVDGGVGVRTVACAESLRGLFAMRDKPDGMKRRAALRHWVRTHMRHMPDGRAFDIATHLRGAETFDWFGFRCRVFPPVLQIDNAVGDV